MAKTKAPRPKINPELKTVFPPLGGWELAMLTEKLLTEGMREKVPVSEDGDLLDAFHRIIICDAEKLPYETNIIKGLDTLEKKKKWMIDNQLARRNLTTAEWSLFWGRFYNQEKNPYREFQEKQNAPTEEVLENKGRTSERLAEQLRVSPDTIKRAGAFAEAVDSAPEPIKPSLLNGVVPMATTIAAAKEGKPLYCPDHTRKGPMVPWTLCKECVQVRGNIAKPRPKKLPKKGDVLFDWKSLESHLGYVIRSADLIAHGYPEEKDGPEFKTHLRLCSELTKAIAAWKKKLT